MKLNKILFPLCLVASLSIGCSSDNNSSDTPKPTEPAPSQPVLPTDSVPQTDPTVTIDLDTCELKSYSVFVDCKGGEEVIVVRSNRSYSVTPTVSWITVKESRAVAESEVVIDIAENADAEREGVVEFIMNDTQEPITLGFIVTQAAAGVEFEEKTVNDAINDMDNSIWHPKEVHLTFSQSSIYSYTYTDYIESDDSETIDLDEKDMMEFFGLSGRLQEAVDNGTLKRVILWRSTNGTEWKETSVKEPRLPDGYDFGASYRSTGVVIPITSSFTTLYSIGAKSATQLELMIDKDSMVEGDMYYGGVRYTMVDDELGDTYNYDIKIHMSYSNEIL